MKSTSTLHLPPGFTTTIVAEDRMAIGLMGRAGAGKTRFCCTPKDPIGYIPLNRKCRKTVEKWGRELCKTIIMPENDFIRVKHPLKIAAMSTEQAIKHYRTYIDEVKLAAFTLYEMSAVETLVIDDCTTFFESLKFAIWGRPQDINNFEKGPLNQEMKQFVDGLSGKNLILVHQAKEIWETAPGGKGGRPTGNIWYEGWPHLEYAVNSIVEVGFDPSKDLSKRGVSGRYYLKIAQCQDNPTLQGHEKYLVDDMVNFQNLAMLMYPESDVEQWG